MKSDRRHELQQNELAIWLGRSVGLVKPYSTAILGVLLLASLVVAGLLLRNHTSAAQAGDEWNDYFLLVNNDRATTSDFENLAKRSSSSVKDWARMTSADRRLERACDLLFTNKGLARDELNAAAEDYTTLLASASADSVRERATLGLARTQEALGDLGDAVKTYEGLQTQWPKGPYAEKAAERMGALKTDEAHSFRDRFAKSLTKPPVPESKENIFSGDKLEFPPLPKGRPASVPPATEGTGTGKAPLKIVAPQTAPKETPAAKPVEGKPAETKPADVKGQQKN